MLENPKGLNTLKELATNFLFNVKILNICGQSAGNQSKIVFYE